MEACRLTVHLSVPLFLNMADAIADYYGIELVEVLQFIGQKILEFEKTGKGTGMEESYGCLTEPCRDKDAIVASMTLCPD